MFFVVGVSSTVWPLTSGACLSACSIASHIRLYGGSCTESICASLPLCVWWLQAAPYGSHLPVAPYSGSVPVRTSSCSGGGTVNRGTRLFYPYRQISVYPPEMCLFTIWKSINKALKTKKEMKKSCRAPRPQLALSLLLMLLNNYQWWLLLLLLLFLVFLFLLLYPITAMNDFMLSLLV